MLDHANSHTAGLAFSVASAGNDIASLNQLSQQARIPISFSQSQLPASNPHLPQAGWMVEVAWGREVSLYLHAFALSVPFMFGHGPKMQRDHGQSWHVHHLDLLNQLEKGPPKQ